MPLDYDKKDWRFYMLHDVSMYQAEYGLVAFLMWLIKLILLQGWIHIASVIEEPSVT